MSEHVFKLPDLGEGTVSAEIVAWHAKPGDVLKEDQPLVEMSTDKAVVEVPAPVSGRVLTIAGKPGDVIAVGAVLATFDTSVATAAAATVPTATRSTAVAGGASAAARATATAATPMQRGDGTPVRASPATRRRAQEAGVDLAAIAGTGPGGRITPEDLGALLRNPDGAMHTAATPPASVPAASAATADERPEEVPVIGIRRVIAQRMSEAARSIPHFAYVEEVDITALHAYREHLNRTAAAGATALSYLPFIVAALVRALERFPQCNAQYDGQRELLLRHRAVHVGIATQTAEGLKVPVVRNAQRLGIRALGHEITRMAAAARNRSARREELTGSTITVTSLGKLGGIASTPIINMPEVAIIGINRAAQRPMVVDGRIEVRWMMNLSSSFDHRFVDGADAAGLIQLIKEQLESPATSFAAAGAES